MYGALTGLSKQMVAQRHGVETLKKWRRGYSARPPPISSFSASYPGMILYSNVLYCTMLLCTELCCNALYCAVLHYAAMHWTVRCCTALNCTVMYCNVVLSHIDIESLFVITKIILNWDRHSMVWYDTYSHAVLHHSCHRLQFSTCKIVWHWQLIEHCSADHAMRNLFFSFFVYSLTSYSIQLNSTLFSLSQSHNWSHIPLHITIYDPEYPASLAAHLTSLHPHPLPPLSYFSSTGNDDRYVSNVLDVRYSVCESLIRSLGSRKLELHRKFPKAESLKVRHISSLSCTISALYY